MLEERQMWLRTILFSCFVFHLLIVCQAADGIARRDDVRRRRFVLEVDAQHALGAGELHQEILVEEGSTFFVCTRVGKTRWTFAGDVGHTVAGTCPC
jgi:hypothetical protein